MRILVLVAAVVGGAVVGANWGWRWVLAPLLGWLFIRWAIASLRSMAGGERTQAALDQPQPVSVAPAERTLYWCEDCGTELLLLTRGTGKAPRHCATPMHARDEVPRN